MLPEQGRSISIGAVVLYIALVYWIGTRGFEWSLFPVVNLIMLLLIWLVLLGGICLEIVAFVRGRQTIEKIRSPEPLRERIITERVLVMCPFCSTKVEQGVPFCPNCGGKM